MSPAKKRETIVYLSDLGGTRGIPIRSSRQSLTQNVDGLDIEIPMPQQALPPEIRFVPCVPRGYFGASMIYRLEPTNKYYEQIRKTIEGDPADPEWNGLIRYMPDGPEIAKLVRLQAREVGFAWAPRGIWREDVVKQQLFEYDVKVRAGERRRLLAAIASYKNTEFDKELEQADKAKRCNYELEDELKTHDKSYVERTVVAPAVDQGVATTQTVVR
jgi:hypothetical protein